MIRDLINYSHLRLRYFFRLRKSRGFGIHSPFVFHLVTHVIKDKNPFYVFDLLNDEISKYSYRDAKYAKIIYRIINELKIKHIYCESKMFLCSRNICERGDSQHNFLSSMNEKVDGYKLIYAGDDDFKELLSSKTIDALKGTQTIVVLNEMYKNDDCLDVYKKLKEESQVSLDLFYRTILFFDHKLQKGSYSIKV
jgi:hypothetical protein